jgi:hypothetical protein
MKKLIIAFLLCVTVMSVKAQDNSQWKTQPNHKLELNYNLLGRQTAQGAFYGAAGYGMGMWLSNHNTVWGMVGSVLTANLPILIDGRYKEPETLIGRNLGALSVGLSATFIIEMNRRGRLNFNLYKPIQR